jgi:activator of Hsp90 ATPase-like protein
VTPQRPGGRSPAPSSVNGGAECHTGSDRLPPSASTVEVRLTAAAGGTRVEIEHRDLPADLRAAFGRGWPHFLARLAVAAPGGDPGPDPFAS